MIIDLESRGTSLLHMKLQKQCFLGRTVWYSVFVLLLRGGEEHVMDPTGIRTQLPDSSIRAVHPPLGLDTASKTSIAFKISDHKSHIYRQLR